MSENAKQPIMYDSEEYYEAVKDYQGLTELRGGEIVYFVSPNTMQYSHFQHFVKMIGEFFNAVKSFQKNLDYGKIMRYIYS